MNAAFQRLLAEYSNDNWSIGTVTDALFTAQRQVVPLSHWIVAIIFFPLGLLVLLIKNTENVVITSDGAEAKLNAYLLERKKAKNRSTIFLWVIVGLMVSATILCGALFVSVGSTLPT